MDSNSEVKVAKLPLKNSQKLRNRAERKLRKELLIKGTLPTHDISRQLYELRLNQIEVELLSEEFKRLGKKATGRRILGEGESHPGNGYFILNAEGRILDAKFPQRTDIGGKPGKWFGQYLKDFIPHDKNSFLSDFLQDVFESDERKSAELMFDQANGKNRLGLKIPKYALIEAVADDSKEICLFVIEDITTRKMAEQQVKASKAALSMLDKTIAASRNEIFMFDAQSLHFTFANQRALENIGYTMDELKWLTPTDIQNNIFNQDLADTISYLSSHRDEVRKLNAVHLRKDGSMYPVEIYLHLFEHENGSDFVAILLDISQQKAIESKLESIVESAGAIIWAVDEDLNLVFLSNQILDILGFKGDQFIGHTLTELLDSGFFHESDKHGLCEGFNQVTRGCKISDLNFRAKHADGTWRWISMNMTPNLSVGGGVGQIVGVMHDISAQKLAEEELLKLNQDLDLRVQEEVEKNKEKDLLLQRQSRMAGMGEMIGNIAHQWRQPINSLGLILSDLEDSALYGECDHQYIKNAVARSRQIIQKMSTTIDDFRDFFRADKSLGAFSLAKVSYECLNLVEASMKNSNINIIVKIEKDVDVIGYANEYSQALMNILANARDAIIEKNIAEGRIIIDITENDEYGIHAVSDNGGGILPEIMPKIFEPHFTTKKQGVGIGLYMTVVSVEKHMKGKIVVENVANGVKFSMYLPKFRAGEQYVIN